MVLGPCNTVTANVVPANLRATGYATFIFLIHLFGDISSPMVMGWISTYFGRPDIAASPIGRFFASIGAVPVQDGDTQTNLTLAMLSVLPVMLLGIVFFLIGSHYLPRDEDRAVAEGGKPDDGSSDTYFHH